MYKISGFNPGQMGWIAGLGVTATITVFASGPAICSVPALKEYIARVLQRLSFCFSPQIFPVAPGHLKTAGAKKKDG